MNEALYAGMYEDPDYLDPHEECISIEEMEKYKEGEHWIKIILHQMYYEGNIKILEEAVEELASIYDYALPEVPLILKKEKKNG